MLALMISFLSTPHSLAAEEWNVVLAVAIFAGFICMALLLPDFDGTEDSDWSGQGDDLWKH